MVNVAFTHSFVWHSEVQLVCAIVETALWLAETLSGKLCYPLSGSISQLLNTGGINDYPPVGSESFHELWLCAYLFLSLRRTLLSLASLALQVINEADLPTPDSPSKTRVLFG